MIQQTILLIILIFTIIASIVVIDILFKIRKKLLDYKFDFDNYKPSDKNYLTNISDFSKILDDIKKFNGRNKKN